MTDPTKDTEVIAEDVRTLRSLGYKQELLRKMGGFSNFAISFSIISILTGAILLFGEPGEGHLRALHEGGGLEDHVVDVLVGPVAAFALKSGRVAEALMARLLAADDVPQVGADLVGAALLRRVASDALLVHGFAGGRICACEEHCDRLLGGRCGTLGCLGLGSRDGETFLLGVWGGKDRIRDDGDRKDDKYRAEEGADQRPRRVELRRLRWRLVDHAQVSLSVAIKERLRTEADEALRVRIRPLTGSARRGRGPPEPVEFADGSTSLGR